MVTALGTLGIDVSALVAGLGLTGFALGFAFRMFFERAGRSTDPALPSLPPRRQDSRYRIRRSVTNIDLRYTTIDAGDRIILIPNSNLFTNPIEVWAANKSERSVPNSSGAAI